MPTPLERATLIAAEDLRGDDELLVLSLRGGGLEGRRTDRHEVLLFAYSDPRELVESCGPAQPWVRLRKEELSALPARMEATVLVAIDAWHPEGERYAEQDVREMEPLAYAEHVPPLTEAWIPSLPVVPGARAAQVELYAVRPGEPMLLAYGSLEDLRACCGEHQAAIRVNPEDLDAVTAEAGAHGVLFDAVLDQELRYSGPVVDWAHRDVC
ncbi:hypothetical protein EV193_11094 [Herbihabitans rhizosphaerae]|uniref:Type III secretion system (T3SS) SseB-like protein n=1 Tax=Herbihabitans rhizosphaerae TaxID=1872711 RepID=A0A4Q7KHD2_9PSEU|nr:SAV_915 family protein [Herbihabitans rhizosphaerae]RZS33944.1 hypothetical protein EV193_11094 [Herbihabitans rhizosphaerae]